MKTLIIYDSLYGNTEMIANAISEGLMGSVAILPIAKVTTADLEKLNLLIVGSPVHGGRPTPAVDMFLKNVPNQCFKNVQVAAFDTRFAPQEHGIGLRVLMSIIQYAAQHIAKELIKKGGTLIAKPEGFIVHDKEGPLKKGERERAKKWAHTML